MYDILFRFFWWCDILIRLIERTCFVIKRKKEKKREREKKKSISM